MTKDLTPQLDDDQATHIAGLMGVVDVILGMNSLRGELSRIGMPKTRIDGVMGDILTILTTDAHEGENTKSEGTRA